MTQKKIDRGKEETEGMKDKQRGKEELRLKGYHKTEGRQMNDRR